jgi:hypothetical protein
MIPNKENTGPQKMHDLRKCSGFDEKDLGDEVLCNPAVHPAGEGLGSDQGFVSPKRVHTTATDR